MVSTFCQCAIASEESLLLPFVCEIDFILYKMHIKPAVIFFTSTTKTQGESIYSENQLLYSKALCQTLKETVILTHGPCCPVAHNLSSRYVQT